MTFQAKVRLPRPPAKSKAVFATRSRPVVSVSMSLTKNATAVTVSAPTPLAAMSSARFAALKSCSVSTMRPSTLIWNQSRVKFTGPKAKMAPMLQLTDSSGFNWRPPFSMATGLVGGRVRDSCKRPSLNTVAARRRLLWPTDGARKPVLPAARRAKLSEFEATGDLALQGIARVAETLVTQRPGPQSAAGDVDFQVKPAGVARSAESPRDIGAEALEAVRAH